MVYVLPSDCRSQPTAAVELIASPSGLTWETTSTSSTDSMNALVSCNCSSYASLFLVISSFLLIDLLQQLLNMAAVFNRRIELEDQLRRMTQADPASKLRSNKALSFGQRLQRFFLLFV